MAEHSSVLGGRSGFLFPSATKSCAEPLLAAPMCSFRLLLRYYVNCVVTERLERAWGVGMAGKAVVSLDVDRKGVHLNRLSSS